MGSVILLYRKYKVFNNNSFAVTIVKCPNLNSRRYFTKKSGFQNKTTCLYFKVSSIEIYYSIIDTTALSNKKRLLQILLSYHLGGVSYMYFLHTNK